MKEKAKINYTVVIFLNFLLVFSISVVCIFLLVQNADANQDNHTEQPIEQRFTDWTVYDFDSIFLYTTHGQAVHGHRFGFMKRPGYCESDLFYFSWSTYKDEVRSYEGEEVTFQMKIKKDDFYLTMPIVDVYQFLPKLNLVAFSNVIADQEFLFYLGRGGNIEVVISTPQRIIEKFDIRNDRFSLNGFELARDRAALMCEEQHTENQMI